MKIHNNDTEYSMTLTRDNETLDFAGIRPYRNEEFHLIIGINDDVGEDGGSITLSLEEARLLHQHLNSPEMQALLFHPSLSVVA